MVDFTKHTTIADIEIRVLGITSLLVRGEATRLTPVERNLVGLLVAAGPSGANTDQLADGLWNEDLPDSWRASLRNIISRLNIKVRAALSPADPSSPTSLISERTALRRLQLEPDQVDAWRLLARADEVSEESASLPFPDQQAGAQTRPSRSLALRDPGSIDPQLLAGTPFSGCEISETVQGCIERVDSARYDLVAAWTANRTQLPGRTLAALRQLCGVERDQRLVLATVRLHLMVGDHDGARTLISTTERELAIARRRMSPPLEMLKRRMDEHEADYWVRDGTNPTPSTTTAIGESQTGSRSAPRSGRNRLRSTTLGRLIEGELVGRRATVDRLVEQLAPKLRPPPSVGSGVALYGPPGVGRTRMAAEVATRLQDQGFNTIYLSGAMPGSTADPLRPFVQALRFLQPVVEPFLSQLDKPDRVAVAWARALHAIESAIEPGPTCLVADDVEQFDIHSRSLLLSLCQAELSSPLAVIAIGSDAAAHHRWSTWLDDLKQAGLAAVEVEPLDTDAMTGLVESRLGLGTGPTQPPEIGRLHFRVLADRIIDLSAGRPEVARWLLDEHERTWTGDHPSSPLFDLQHQPWDRELPAVDRWANGHGLDAALIRIAAAVAVLGPNVVAADVAALLDRDIDRVVDGLDDLVQRRLLTDSAPGRYRPTHVLAAEAMGRWIPRYDRRVLHAKAVALADNIHDQARHRTNSVPITPVPEAAAALVASAIDHFKAGRHLDSWAQWQRAMRLSPAALGLEDQLVALEAAGRAGFSIGAELDQLVSRALEQERPDVAVSAATAGLPDIEEVEGDRDRVLALSRISTEQLDRHQRMRRLDHLVRQQVWIGEMDQARDHARLLAEQAETADHRARAVLAANIVGHILPTDIQDSATGDSETMVEADVEARMACVRHVERIADGQSRLDRGAFDAWLGDARSGRSALEHWYALVQQTTVLTDLGREDEAERRADEALDLGLQVGIRAAPGVYEAQALVRAFLARDVEERLDRVQSLIESGMRNPVLPAAMAACRMSLDDRHPGQKREAVNLMVDLAKAVDDGPFAPTVAGLLAPVVAGSDDDELVDWATQTLEPLRGRHVVAPLGMANLGPCHGLLAQLATDRSERYGLLLMARDEADRQRLPLWRVLCRLDLARDLGPGPRQRQLLDEAESLAATPWLRQVADRRTDFDRTTRRTPRIC